MAFTQLFPWASARRVAQREQAGECQGCRRSWKYWWATATDEVTIIKATGFERLHHLEISIVHTFICEIFCTWPLFLIAFLSNSKQTFLLLLLTTFSLFDFVLLFSFCAASHCVVFTNRSLLCYCRQQTLPVGCSLFVHVRRRCCK